MRMLIVCGYVVMFGCEMCVTSVFCLSPIFTTKSELQVLCFSENSHCYNIHLKQPLCQLIVMLDSKPGKQNVNLVGNMCKVGL